MAGADIRAGRAYVELLMKDAAFLKKLNAAQQRLRAFGGELQSLGRSIAATGVAMAVPFALSIKAFTSFDDAIRAVKAVTGSTAEEFEQLTAQAKKLGATTSFTAIEVATLMTELGRAGFTATQINTMTGAVLNLARATGTDATLSSGIMAAAIRQFGLGAEDATRVADGLTAAANKSFNTVEALGEALSYAGPTAADFGMDIESTLGVLGALGNVGIQGSNAGTAIRRLLTLTGAEASKLQGIFGVSFLDAAGNARPLVDVLGEVNEATKNLGSGERAKKFNDAFGLLGITGASAIGKAAVSAKELEKSIRAAGGTAAKTAAEMDAGIGGAFRIMLSAVEGVSIAIGETLSDAVSTGAKAIELMATAASEWVRENQAIIIGAASAAAGLVAVGGALFGVGLAMNAAGVALGVLTAGLTVLTSPLTIVAAAATAGAYIWIRYSKAGQAALDGFISAVKPFAGIVADTFGAVKEALSTGDLVGAFEAGMLGVKAAAMKGIASLAAAVGGVWGDAIGTIGSQLLGGDFAGAWNTALGVMNDKFKPFVDLVLGTWDIIKAAWDVTVGAIKSAWNTAVDLLSGVWEWWQNEFFGGAEGMGFGWGDFVEGLVTVFADAAKAIADIWFKTTTAISDFIIKDASEGGVLGTAALLGTGIDPATEQGKAELNRRQQISTDKKLLEQRKADLAAANANGGFIVDESTAGVAITSDQLKEQIAELENRLRELGSTTTDVVGDMQRDARASLEADRDAFKANVNKIERRAGERNREQRPGAETFVDGGADQAKADAVKLEEDLAKKRREAELDALAASSKADEEAKKRAEEDRKTTGGGGAPRLGELSKNIVGSFSAASLLASAGSGGSPADRTAKATEEIAKTMTKEAPKQSERMERIERILDSRGLMTA